MLMHELFITITLTFENEPYNVALELRFKFYSYPIIAIC